MLLGLVRPTAGTGTVLGEPLERPERYLGRVGALVEGPGAVAGAHRGRRTCAVLARLGGHDERRIPDVLDLVGLADRAGDRFGEYSLGMKQRLGIAAALLGDPELLVLDEPTNGLDPVGISEMRDLIGRLAARRSDRPRVLPPARASSSRSATGCSSSTQGRLVVRGEARRGLRRARSAARSSSGRSTRSSSSPSPTSWRADGHDAGRDGDHLVVARRRPRPPPPRRAARTAPRRRPASCSPSCTSAAPRSKSTYLRLLEGDPR